MALGPEFGLFVGAFLAGLLGSPHCVGMCGPFALACGGPGGRSAFWHLGRLTTYACLGALAGSLGSALPGPGWLAAVVSTVLIVWFAGVLAGVFPEPRWTPPFLRRVATDTLTQRRYRSTFVFGLANGLLPCGLVYAGLGLAVSAAGPLGGASVMLAFGLGTVPALAVFTAGIRRFALKDIRVRRALAVLVLLSGLISVAMRMGLLGMPGMSAEHMHGTEATTSTQTR